MRMSEADIEELGILIVPEDQIPEEWLGRPGLTRDELALYVRLRTAQVYGISQGMIWPSDAVMLGLLEQRITIHEDLWAQHMVFDRTVLVERHEFEEGTMTIIHGSHGLEELMGIADAIEAKEKGRKRTKKKKKHQRKY